MTAWRAVLEVNCLTQAAIWNRLKLVTYQKGICVTRSDKRQCLLVKQTTVELLTTFTTKMIDEGIAQYCMQYSVQSLKTSNHPLKSFDHRCRHQSCSTAAVPVRAAVAAVDSSWPNPPPTRHAWRHKPEPSVFAHHPQPQASSIIVVETPLTE